MSDSELESSDISDKNSAVKNSDNPALNNTSETELDEGEGEGNPESKGERITASLLEKYKEREGKQLFIRFPHRLPEEQVAFEAEVHALSPLIVKAHKPRQKHARFCLVDFNTKEDRDKTLQSLRATAKVNPYFKVVASRPRTENRDFVKQLAEKKLQTLERKKAKARLRRASKLSVQGINFTSCIVVHNLPKSATVSDVRQMFPNAVDIQLKGGKGKFSGGASVAAVTLPSTVEARAAIRKQYSLNGKNLIVRFDTQHAKKKHMQVGQKRKAHVTEEAAAKGGTGEPQGKKSKIETNTQKKKGTGEPKAETTKKLKKKNAKSAYTKQKKINEGKLLSKTKQKTK